MIRALPQRLRVLLPYAVILAAVLVCTSGVLLHMGARIVGLAEDHWVKGVAWFYWNIAWSPLRGIDPFFNDLQAYPVGFDQIAAAGNFGDALMAAPFFWAFPLPAAYNLTIIAFLFFNGAAAYFFFRRWWGGRLLPLLFALANTFHPLIFFFLAEGRSTHMLFGWVYLALAGLKPLLDDPERGSTRLLVVALWGSFVCFWYNGFFLYMLLPIVALATARGMSGAQRRALLWRGGRALGLAVLLAFPFGLPLFRPMAEPEGIKGVHLLHLSDPRLHVLFSARPWEPLLAHPRYHMWLPWSLLAVGLLALIPGLGGGRRPRAVAGFAAGAAVFYLLILGPYLQLGEGNFLFGGRLVSLPWAWLACTVPFFSRLSYPYVVFPLLLLTLLFLGGWALSRLAERGGWRRWLAWSLAAAVVVEVVLRGGMLAVTTPYVVPEFYADLREDTSVRAIIEYPFGAADFRQVFQTVHLKPVVNQKGNEFNVLLSNPPLKEFFDQTPALTKLYAYQLREAPLSDITAQDRAQLVEQGFDVLVVSEQAVSRSRLLRDRGVFFPVLVAALSAVFGQPYYTSDTLAAFRLHGG